VRTGTTGTNGGFFWKIMLSSLGNAMVPKSKVRQTFLATPLWKTEPFTLNGRQTYDSMAAELIDESQTESGYLARYRKKR
jgi:hypothetical protein